jgi:hypothetical protein
MGEWLLSSIALADEPASLVDSPSSDGTAAPDCGGQKIAVALRANRVTRAQGDQPADGVPVGEREIAGETAASSAQ